MVVFVNLNVVVNIVGTKNGMVGDQIMDHYIDNNSYDDMIVCPNCGEELECQIHVCLCALCNCLQSICQCYNCSLQGDNCPTKQCKRKRGIRKMTEQNDRERIRICIRCNKLRSWDDTGLCNKCKWEEEVDRIKEERVLTSKVNKTNKDKTNKINNRR